ncbi:MAG TPA: transglutaminase-like domain-containing protein [Methanobacterium sp.]|nr:transglutaminase-like domain-containing protein [Methanobacterium sp.]HOI39729.1 transglutaminase-like domain-containing protein [Methanobacterium sp.]
MLNLIQKDGLKEYTRSSQWVDYETPQIQKKALELSQDMDGPEMVENIYNFVRDEIDHSMDAGQDMVTFKASEVLKKGHGICFAKSNLLAALLRFMGIPTGFCYQRLVHEDGYLVHGLNAVYIIDNWVRMDARGNNHDIDAQFFMDKEKLAFPIQEVGEDDYPYICSNPDGRVTEAMVRSKNVEEAYKNIPTSLTY